MGHTATMLAIRCRLSAELRECVGPNSARRAYHLMAQIHEVDEYLARQPSTTVQARHSTTRNVLAQIARLVRAA